MKPVLAHVLRPCKATGLHTAAERQKIDMSAARDSTENTWPPVLGRSAAWSLRKEESLLVLKPIPSAQTSGPQVS
jgi:hypothetical protein